MSKKPNSEITRHKIRVKNITEPFKQSDFDIRNEPNYSHTNYKRAFRESKNVVYQPYKKINNFTTSLIILIMILSPMLVIFFAHTPISSITIYSKNYTPHFTLWGSEFYEYYSDQTRESINNNNVSLIYCVYDGVFETIKTWNDNYPNVSIYLAVYSNNINGGYTWDGCVWDVIIKSKEYVNRVISENLTNVVGLIYDFESPYYSGSGNKTMITTFSDIGRHQDAIQKWTDFFTWLHENAPNMTTTAVPFVNVMNDLKNHNDIIELMLSTTSVIIDSWTYIAPMVYRAMPPKNYQPNPSKPFQIDMYSDSSEALHTDTTYEFYMKAKKSFDIITNYSNITPSIIIGMSNSSCYQFDHQITELGQSLGNGFDVFIRDIRILKAIGYKEIQIYTDKSDRFMFDSYGNDTIDRIISLTNTTTPIIIPIGHLLSYVLDPDLFYFPLLYISLQYWYIWIGLIGFVFISIYISKKNQFIKIVENAKYSDEI